MERDLRHEAPPRGRAVNGGRTYDAFYFEHSCGVPYRRDEHWLSFFGRIAESIAAEIRPRSVLDAGCAMGFLVEALRDRGVEAWGIDISEYALEHVREDIKPYCRLASVTEPLQQRYDLIACIEVLEHLPRAEALAALDNLTEHCESLLFSSSPVDFAEPTHVNVQPPEWWAEQISRRGLVRDLDFDAGLVTDWAGLFRHGSIPVPRLVAGYERRLWQLTQGSIGARDALEELRARARELEDANRQTTARADAFEAELSAARQELGAATEELASLRAKLEATSAALHALERTRTLRYTRPARRAYAALRQRVGGREAEGTAAATSNADATSGGDPLTEEFARRGPWVTSFTIDGRPYGGDLALSNDRRIQWFLERFADASSVLELGSLEGGHSFQLARAGISVVAVEGRSENIERARFVQSLLGVDRVTFVEADLERAALTRLGTFDAVVCLGLLYHLPKPWELIDQLADVAPGVFIWTHCAREPEVELEGLEGAWYGEHGRADPLSGLSSRSFWPTLPALLRRLEANGFAKIEIVEDEPTHPHGPAVTFAAWLEGGGSESVQAPPA